MRAIETKSTHSALTTEESPVPAQTFRIVILGLSITSSWGNGHATTYRGLVHELSGRGHDVLFLERDVPWYARKRDLAESAIGRVELYSSLGDLKTRFADEVREADFVMLGSYVPDGVRVGKWLLSAARGATAFYDIDTPVTLAKLRNQDREYLEPDLIPKFDVYLSFAGGPVLDVLREDFGARRVAPFYCCIDPEIYAPSKVNPVYELGYMGTYSKDRQDWLQELLLEPARTSPQGRFVVAGPLYPVDVAWPGNVRWVEHLAPAEHRAFYGAQRFTLNLTRADMVKAGYSPSTRLFEASACATPVITDPWEGLPDFLEPGNEILVARSRHDVMAILHDLPETERLVIGQNARKRVLQSHTASRRAMELEDLITALRG